MLAPLDPVRDLRLSGQVIYTGRSSMEVAVKMEALGNDDAEETIMLGRIGTIYLLSFHLNTFFRSVLHGLQRCEHASGKKCE